jgi:hypothetical protein
MVILIGSRQTGGNCRNQALAQVCAVCSPHLRDWGAFECNRDITSVTELTFILRVLDTGEPTECKKAIANRSPERIVEVPDALAHRYLP